MSNVHHPTASAVRGALASARKTQLDAAQILGLSQASVSRRLRGDVEFTATEIRTLSMWLALPVADLIGDMAGAA